MSPNGCFLHIWRHLLNHSYRLTPHLSRCWSKKTKSQLLPFEEVFWNMRLVCLFFYHWVANISWDISSIKLLTGFQKSRKLFTNKCLSLKGSFPFTAHRGLKIESSIVGLHTYLPLNNSNSPYCHCWYTTFALTVQCKGTLETNTNTKTWIVNSLHPILYFSLKY